MEMHNAFNAMLSLIKSPVTRSNSIFVGDYGSAGYYGDRYAIFPIGNFEYAWSPPYEDLLMLKADELARYTKKRFVEKHSHGGYIYLAPLDDPKTYDLAKVKNLFDINTGLQNALHTNHEVMIKCDAAVYVSEEMYKTAGVQAELRRSAV